jgi:hypothetical protein
METVTFAHKITIYGYCDNMMVFTHAHMISDAERESHKMYKQCLKK